MSHFSHKIYFACPKGMVECDEVPKGCGLVVYCDQKKSWRFVKAATKLKGPDGTGLVIGQSVWISLLMQLDKRLC